MNSGAFGYVDVLKTAADASWLREEVLTNNIANVDTPNYKRQDVEFTTYLKSALEQAGTPASTLTQKVNEAIHEVITPPRVSAIMADIINLFVFINICQFNELETD